MKVITLNGNIINVGEWDKCIVEEFDEKGNKIRDIIKNPLPDGAIEEDIEISYTVDGKIVRADDYRALRKSEYPAIGDQLDAIWKGGYDMDIMRLTILSVKEKYPKPY